MQLLFLKKLVNLFREPFHHSRASDQAQEECSDVFRSVITDEALAHVLSSVVMNGDTPLPPTDSPGDVLNQLHLVRSRLLFLF